MDRMRACGVCDVGSIPTEGTKIKILTLDFLHLKCYTIYTYE